MRKIIAATIAVFAFVFTIYAQPGGIDPSFNPGVGANGSVLKALEQSDGKIIIVGGFSSYGGTARNYVVRLNSSGTIDTSFNFGAEIDNFFMTASIQNDGKIIIGGGFINYDNNTVTNPLARLNADGSIDGTFAIGAGPDRQVEAIAIQSDGKIIIGGTFNTYNGISRSRIARLNADGTLDTTFNPGSGINGAYVSSISIQSDGKIIIVGDFISYNGNNRNNIARLNADGTFDSTFNQGIGPDSQIDTCTIQSDAKIIIGGDFNTYNGTLNIGIARLNEDGTLDTSFNVGGGTGNGGVSTVRVLSDGKIIIGGFFNFYDYTARNGIARLNSDGTLDTSFDPGAGTNNGIRCLTVLSNGKIIIGGDFTSYDGIGRNRIARILSSVITVNETQIMGLQCGTTLALLKSNIKADIVSGAQNYRFQVTNGAEVRTFETLKSNFNLTSMTGSKYNTTYGVRVAVKIAGVWGSYGVSCNITTPPLVGPASLPTSDLRITDCGATLATLGTPVHSQLAYGAALYRFEITNGSVITSFDTSKYYFFLNKMAGTTYGTTYSIRVATNVEGVWSNYGAPCNVTTPDLTTANIPITQIRADFCGTTLAALNTKIPATLVYGAEGYRFEITNGGAITEYDSSIYLFRLADAALMVSTGTTYAIRVKAKISGVYGNYGASCNVSTPSPSSRQIAQQQIDVTDEIKISAYPNPSNGFFKLHVDGANSETFSVSIFDMMGRQIENKTINASDLENIALGQNYVTGIYNVIVSQGAITKTVRLVKN